MSWKTSCPHCQTRYKLANRLAGQRIQCQHCQQWFGVGVPSQPSAVPSAGTGEQLRTAPQRGRRFPLLLVGAGGLGLLVAAAVVVLVLVLNASPVEQKLKELKGGDAVKSAQALEWLAEADPQDDQRPRVTAALETLLTESDVHLAQDPDLLLRTYLSWAGKDNVPDLIRLINHPPSPFWNSARTGLVMAALGKLNDERGAQALADHLSDRKLHEQAVSALEIQGPDAEKAVLEYLFDTDPDTRQRARRLLVSYGTRPQALAAAALERLGSNQSDDSHRALVYFVDYGPGGATTRDEAAPLLVRFLNDPSPEVRRQALVALKSWATPACLPRLLEHARGKQLSSSAHPLLIDVLVQFPEPAAAEALALQLPNRQARPKALRALLQLGPGVASGAVLPYLNYPDEDVQKAARELSQKLNITAARQLEQTLADVAGSDAPRSQAALQYLTQHLTQLRLDEAMRPKVAQALNAPLFDPNKDIRAEALKAVAVWGTRANTATLLKLLGDYQMVDWPGYNRIVEVLGSLRDPAAAPVLAQGLTYGTMSGAPSRALMTIGPAAEKAVVPYLRSPDRGARIEACRVLAAISTRDSLPALRDAKVANMSDPQFLQFAEDAMQKIQSRK